MAVNDSESVPGNGTDDNVVVLQGRIHMQTEPLSEVVVNIDGRDIVFMMLMDF